MNNEAEDAADRLRAAERLVDWLGPRSRSTGHSDGERAPLVNLTLVSQPRTEVIELAPSEGTELPAEG